MPSRLTLATLAASTCLFVVPVAQAQTRYSFDMGAQPLEAALRSVATRTSTNIIFDGPAIRGRTAPPLHGEFTAQAALQRLLKDTQLIVERAPSSRVSPEDLARGKAAGADGHIAKGEFDQVDFLERIDRLMRS